MALNIVLGKPKTGKSTYIYEKIQKDIKNKKNVILFVPSQKRQAAENNYIKFLKKSGIIGVKITTISEYVKENIKKIGLCNDDNYVSIQDKKMILTEVIYEMSDELEIFKNASKKEGFLELIYVYIDLIRKSGIDVKKVDNIEIENKLTVLKLREICKIYNNYEKKVQKRFVDGIDEIDMFIKNISKFEFSNFTIYFDSYNNFTKKELEIIKTFLLLNCDITISLTTDITGIEDIHLSNTNDIFQTSNMTYQSLLNIASGLGVIVNNKIMYIKYLNQQEDIKYLSDNVFFNKTEKKKDANNIHINLFSNAFLEIQNIANIINKKIREGYRYRDFDIYTTDLEKYKDIVSRIFFNTKIPVYINYKENIKFSKLTTYIVKYLQILKNGIKRELLLDILKLGFCNINEVDIYEFENYILEFNITDYYITKPFKLNNIKNNEHIYNLERLNEIRNNLIKEYQVDIKKEENAKWYIEYIWAHLNNSGVLEKYRESLIKIEDNFSEFDISSLDKEKQVWNKICEIFNSISKVYKEKNISFDTFVNVFNLQLKDTFVKVAPPVLDSVNLLDINLSNGKESKIAFFIGVNEGDFPKNVEEDILFSNENLNGLKKCGIDLRETTISKQNMALYNIFSTLNSITDELYISIPSSDYSGKSLRISSIVGDIKKIINIHVKGNVVEDFKNDNFNSIYSKNQMLEYMVQHINNEDNSKNIDQIASIYEYIYSEKMYKDLFEYKKDDRNLDENSLKKIYGKSFNTSISKLELFKKCPFSYYMKYLLKVEPRREFEISSLDIGSFMHEVLEEFSKYLLENGITWQSLLLDNDWNAKLDEIIENKLNINLGSKKQSIKYEILKIKLIKTMIKVVKVIATSFNQSEFVPYGYEIEFKDGKLFAPIKIKIDESYTMNIIGKIDRVDVLNDDDKMYVRIVDYKSSRKDLKLDDIKEGISLQLITYLDSFIENMKKEKKVNYVLPAGMLYFNLSDKLVNLKDYTNDEEKMKDETIKALRMKGIFLKDVKIIEKMDKKLATEKRLIDISKSTLNKNTTNRALSKNEYNELFIQTKEILSKIGNELINGVVRIKPNKKCEYCKYCNYSSVCRKDSLI